MMADGRVRRGCSLSFDALPPNVLFVLNLDGQRIRRVQKVQMRRTEVQRGQSMSISD